jgi:putative sterol carrier protein
MSDDLKKLAADTIKTMEKRLNEAKTKNENWGKTINIIFPDIETGYAMKFAMDGSIEKIEKKPASETKVEGDAVTSAIGKVQDVTDVVDGKYSPMDAGMAGMFKVEGNFTALNRLMPCFPQAEGLSI